MRIAHLSDIHFGTEIPEVVEGLVSRLRQIEPDLIIASGDFTMAGRRHEYRAAADLLRRFDGHIVATPGNHDIPYYALLERFTVPFRRYAHYIGPLTSRSFISPTAAILSVNSARPWDLSFNWSHGRLSNRQIARADQFFSKVGKVVLRALVVHHPFFVPEDLPGFRTLRNGQAMLDVLARHGVQVVFSGHLHRQFRTVRTIPIEKGEHEIVVLQVSTATSSRRRDQPNAFSLVTIENESLVAIAQVWNGNAFVPGETETVVAPLFSA